MDMKMLWLLMVLTPQRELATLPMSLDTRYQWHMLQHQVLTQSCAKVAKLLGHKATTKRICKVNGVSKSAMKKHSLIALILISVLSGLAVATAASLQVRPKPIAGIKPQVHQVYSHKVEFSVHKDANESQAHPNLLELEYIFLSLSYLQQYIYLTSACLDLTASQELTK